MAEITSTYSDKFHNVEAYIYIMVLKTVKGDADYTRWPGIPGRVSVAAEMVKAFAPIHQAFVEGKLSRPSLVEWLIGIEANPIEISEIVEMMEENKHLVYDARARRLEAIKNRPTGE